MLSSGAGMFEVSKKLILNKKGKIFLMPVSDPPYELDEYKPEHYGGLTPNSVLIQLRNAALRQHPEWIADVELNGSSFGFTMLLYPEMVETLKKHPEIKNFLKNRVLLERRAYLVNHTYTIEAHETALHIAIAKKNLPWVRWLVEEIDFTIYQQDSSKKDFVENAIYSHSQNILSYFVGREDFFSQTEERKTHYLIEAIRSGKEMAKTVWDALKKLPDKSFKKILSLTFSSLVVSGDIPNLLDFISLAEFKIEEDHIKNIEGGSHRGTVKIKHALWLCQTMQQGILNFANNNDEKNHIDETNDRNIFILNKLIEDIQKINLPVTIGLGYLSYIMDTIRKTQKQHENLAAAVTFFTEHYIRPEQELFYDDDGCLEETKHWSHELLKKDPKLEMTRNCFNLFFKSQASKQHKELVRNALYKGLEEELKPLTKEDQMVLKKKAVMWGHSMFVAATSGSGEGTRGAAMKKEVDVYEKAHGRLLI